ncbi:hypothetical protein CVD28_17070 [Bacillus sp. M6-12]|nr:hypothetical protein CVD28_17070 [Bacillus sp. M6-12]
MNEASKLLGISPTTIRRLEENGQVKGYGIRVHYTPGGQRRYSVAEIEQYFISRGFFGKIGFGKSPVLLVVDCINAFTSKESPMHGDWNKEVENINDLVYAAHKTDCPVIFSHSYYEDGDPGLTIWAKKIEGMKALTPDSSWVQLDNRIKQKKNDIHIYSKYVSIYYQSTLLNELRKHNCDTLIICGFSTSGAIRAVSAETIQYGIRPIVPMEAVGDRDEHVHRNNLSDLDRKFADVLSVAEVIQYLFGRTK